MSSGWRARAKEKSLHVIGAFDRSVDSLGVVRRKMVGWYDPAQLLRTGLEVVVSTLFAHHSDSRRLDAMASADARIDYTSAELLDEKGDFWFDYTADCGDGWNSTYAVAYTLSQPELEIVGHHPLPRGRLLVLGGDLVYPTPTKENYDDRLVGPYSLSTTFHAGEPAELAAIPGNHDWYDSLVAFRRLFFNGGNIAFRRTRQTRSYFAARLPYNWHLFAVDLQLDHDLDEAQYRFFAQACEDLGVSDRVIVCLPEPVWIPRGPSPSPTLWSSRTLLDRVMESLGPRAVICLAGDLHHYRRHSSKGGQHLITCGAGGAFLHPTHELESANIGSFKLEKSFPSPRKSFWLTFRNLLFLKHNPKFGIAAAAAYLLAAWQNGIYVGETFSEVQLQEMGRLGISHWRDAVVSGVHSAILSPIGLALYAMIFWGFVFFADRTSPRFRLIGGTAHALTHVAAGFLIYWLAAYVSITTLRLPAKSIGQYVAAGGIIVVAGWIVGSVVLGTYLLISLNVFKRHSNEAFSALRIQDWKGFLRARISSDGALKLTFIGLRRVPRAWRVVKKAEDGRAVIRPRRESDLAWSIEDEILIQGKAATRT